jgi:hypothetical protein
MATRTKLVKNRIDELGLSFRQFEKIVTSRGGITEFYFDLEATERALGGVAMNLTDVRSSLQGMPTDVFERIFGELPVDEIQTATIELSNLAAALQAQGGGEFKLDFLTGYAKQYDEVASEIKANEIEIAALRAQGFTNADPKMQELLDKQIALKNSMNEYVNSMVLGFAQAAMLADGIQPGEIEKFMGLGVELGAWRTEAADAAVTAWDQFTSDATGAMNALSADTVTAWAGAKDEVVAMMEEIPNIVTVTVRNSADDFCNG